MRKMPSPSRSSLPILWVTLALLLSAHTFLPLSRVSVMAVEEHGEDKYDAKEHEVIEGISVTFRNELSKDIVLHWDEEEEDHETPGGEPLPLKHHEQGTIAANGGELTQTTYPGHQFSYVFGGYRHFVVIPPQKHVDHHGLEHILMVLLGSASEILVKCTCTTEGGKHKNVPLTLRIIPDWAPRGAAQFLDLVRAGYYDGVALTRVVPGFLTQFGISPNVELRRQWQDATIPDDTPLHVGFSSGTLSYAGSGPDSRTTEVFVVMPGTPQSQLDYFGENSWETPFGEVLLGEEVLGDGTGYFVMEETPVAKWYSYGDMPPWGEGPDPQKIYPDDGYEYLKRHFPKLDYLETCVVKPIEENEHTEL